MIKCRAWSPDGRHIAFVSDRTGVNEIYMVDSSGANVKQLTYHSLDAIHPFWSHNSKNIIFCSELEIDSAMVARRDTTNAAPWVYEIFTINLDDSNLHRMTYDESLNTYASFSPEESHILFRKAISKTNGEIFVMDSEGSHLLNLTNSSFSDDWPSWSNDGSRIAFGSNRGNDVQIYIMNSDRTGLHQAAQMKGRCTSPKWSPDGKWISFDRSFEKCVNIYLLDMN